MRIFFISSLSALLFSSVDSLSAASSMYTFRFVARIFEMGYFLGDGGGGDGGGGGGGKRGRGK